MEKKKLAILSIPIIIVFIALVLFFSYGGDGIDETPLSGAATGLEVQEETEVKTSCDDGNVCTIDVFNELTNECEHTMTDTCCGNNMCEEDERCDETTGKTGCPEDCSLTCPANLIVNKPGDETQTENVFICGSSVNCEQTGADTFRISGTGTATLTTAVTNIGERASQIITSKFYCDYKTKQAKYDGDKANGMIFRDYFEDEDQDTFKSLNAPQSESNSVAYILDIDMTDKVEPEADVVCRIVFNSDNFVNTQNFNLKFVE